ncbi:uncharacterized protein RCC_04293 [Ramularia collo-cygni]|uniref:Protein kinase domain-containing protein n=1 Tax=Ramularia collo-cygni TaxID=112498 RepID=A0A2D3UTT5_9PEZI|nr:uncharacterized protein RCC_04293 [Ramularia collo-cygni]CZT18448.1 uncharacterized protein RCC_04293 [Ramularia collo-cygni]
MDTSYDKVLDIDIGDDDILYRVQRSNNIVYVRVMPPTMIPNETQRTFGPYVIKELATHTPWSQRWTTLTIDGRGENIEYKIDGKQPHRLDLGDIDISCYEKRNFLELDRIERWKSRVWKVSCLDGTTPMILKIARFQFEVEWMAKEARIYHALRSRDVAPTMVALVYEGTPDRIIGILLEMVEGTCASSSDLDVCREKLAELHKTARHGDLNRWNIIIGPNGPRFIDFEESEFRPTKKDLAFEESLKDEQKQLENALMDESNAGRPCPRPK